MRMSLCVPSLAGALLALLVAASLVAADSALANGEHIRETERTQARVGAHSFVRRKVTAMTEAGAGAADLKTDVEEGARAMQGLGLLDDSVLAHSRVLNETAEEDEEAIFMRGVPGEQDRAGIRRKLASRKSVGLFDKCNIWVGRKGGFSRIQDAVNYVGGNVMHPRRTGVTICIYRGVYNEIVHIYPGQNKITLLGMGKSTIISGGNSRSKVGSPYYAATLIVEGDDFTALSLVVQNTVKSPSDPAPAAGIVGQRSTWIAVGLTGWTDTIGMYTSQHLFVSCYVSGLADIIWGFGRAAFDRSEIYIRFYYDPHIVYIGYVTAMGTDGPSNGITAGAVFWNTKIDGDGQAYLGRPYRASVVVAYVGCYLGKAIVSAGWSDWNGFLSQGHADFKQFKCYGPGASSTHRNYGSVASAGIVPPQYSVSGFLMRRIGLH